MATDFDDRTIFALSSNLLYLSVVGWQVATDFDDRTIFALSSNLLYLSVVYLKSLDSGVYK